MKNSVGKVIMVLGIIALVIGVIMFVVGATTGTITGYQGADGQYYSDPGASGSNEWMCTPGFVIALLGAGVGFVGYCMKD